MLGTEEHFFDLDFYDLLPNPNKFDECDPDLMLNQPPTQNIIRSAGSFNDIFTCCDVKGKCSDGDFNISLKVSWCFKTVAGHNRAR